MTSRPGARFTLLDLMILIGGVAVGLWAVPEGSIHTIGTAIRVTIEHPSARVAASWTHNVMTRSAQPPAAALTFTVLALALRQRRSVRCLAREPGFLACVAAALALLVFGPLNGFGPGRPNFRADLPIAVRVQAYFMFALLSFRHAEGGIAVAGAWLALALGGRWRPRPDWVDRCGRALGIFWVAMIPVTYLLPLL